MILILGTNDPVLLSAAESLLRAAGLAPFIADSYISAVEGSIGILPRRLLVPEEEARQARRLLIDAGLGHELANHG